MPGRHSIDVYVVGVVSTFLVLQLLYYQQQGLKDGTLNNPFMTL